MSRDQNAVQEIASASSSKTQWRSGSTEGEFGEPKVSILLVDDREERLLALEAVLSDLRQNVVKARSGEDALRHLLHQDFAVILLDVSTPGMVGFETAALIRKRLNSEHTPIIFVTSTSISDTENQIAKGYGLGAVDCIRTPIMPEVLRAKVSVFVELQKRTEQIKLQAERLRQIEETEHRKRLTELTDRLEAEMKRNRFFALAIDLLAIADFDGYLLQLSPAWERTLGYSEEELKSKPAEEFVHHQDRSAMCEQLNKVKEGSSTTYFEARYRTKSGSFRWLGWRAAPFVTERLIYIFARDITARKTAEEEIQSLNNELKRRVHELTEINKELEAFSYSISHDLRAPLRAMQGFAQALFEDCGAQLGPHGKDYTRRIVKSAVYMDTLLRDLLDYSRLSRLELEPIPVNLEVTVADVLAQFENPLREKHAEVVIQRPLAAVAGHPSTLRQILSNLVSNALKFVDPERRPKLRIWTRAHEEGMVRIWFEDNGIGIAPDQQERIFGLFQRLHNTESYPGTGIGLALVRKGAERMGGRAGVESNVGKGSRFWVELPAPAHG